MRQLGTLDARADRSSLLPSVRAEVQHRIYRRQCLARRGMISSTQSSTVRSCTSKPSTVGCTSDLNSVSVCLPPRHIIESVRGVAPLGHRRTRCHGFRTDGAGRRCTYNEVLHMFSPNAPRIFVISSKYVVLPYLILDQINVLTFPIRKLPFGGRHQGGQDTKLGTRRCRSQSRNWLVFFQLRNLFLLFSII